MGLLEYLFYLGVIYIVFYYLWSYVVVLPSVVLFTLLKMDNMTYVLKAFGSYLLASLTAVLTLAAIQDVGLFYLILYPAISGFVIFFSCASNYREIREQARLSMNYELMESADNEGYFMVGATALFIIGLFVPIIVANPLTYWLFDIIDWVYNIPILGFLIGIGGILFVISAVFTGFMATLMIGGLLYAKATGDKDDETANIEPEPETEALEVDFCTNCDKEVIERGNFCKYCGERINSEIDGGVTDNRESQKRFIGIYNDKL